MTKKRREQVKKLLRAAEAVGGVQMRDKVFLLLDYNERLEFNYGASSNPYDEFQNSLKVKG